MDLSIGMIKPCVHAQEPGLLMRNCRSEPPLLTGSRTGYATPDTPGLVEDTPCLTPQAPPRTLCEEPSLSVLEHGAPPHFSFVRAFAFINQGECCMNTDNR